MSLNAGCATAGRHVRDGSECYYRLMRRTSRICVYCGMLGSSKEHVWPKWVRDHATEVLGISPHNVQQYEGSQEHRTRAPRLYRVRRGHSRLALRPRRKPSVLLTPVGLPGFEPGTSRPPVKFDHSQCAASYRITPVPGPFMPRRHQVIQDGRQYL